MIKENRNNYILIKSEEIKEVIAALFNNMRERETDEYITLKEAERLYIDCLEKIRIALKNKTEINIWIVDSVVEKGIPSSLSCVYIDEIECNITKAIPSDSYILNVSVYDAHKGPGYAKEIIEEMRYKKKTAAGIKIAGINIAELFMTLYNSKKRMYGPILYNTMDLQSAKNQLRSLLNGECKTSLTITSLGLVFSNYIDEENFTINVNGYNSINGESAAETVIKKMQFLNKTYTDFYKSTDGKKAQSIIDKLNYNNEEFINPLVSICNDVLQKRKDYKNDIKSVIPIISSDIKELAKDKLIEFKVVKQRYRNDTFGILGHSETKPEFMICDYTGGISLNHIIDKIKFKDYLQDTMCMAYMLKMEVDLLKRLANTQRSPQLNYDKPIITAHQKYIPNDYDTYTSIKVCKSDPKISCKCENKGEIVKQFEIETKIKGLYQTVKRYYNDLMVFNYMPGSIIIDQMNDLNKDAEIRDILCTTYTSDVFTKYIFNKNNKIDERLKCSSRTSTVIDIRNHMKDLYLKARVNCIFMNSFVVADIIAEMRRINTDYSVKFIDSLYNKEYMSAFIEWVFDEDSSTRLTFSEKAAIVANNVGCKNNLNNIINKIKGEDKMEQTKTEEINLQEKQDDRVKCAISRLKKIYPNTMHDLSTFGNTTLSKKLITQFKQCGALGSMASIYAFLANYRPCDFIVPTTEDKTITIPSTATFAQCVEIVNDTTIEELKVLFTEKYISNLYTAILTMSAYKNFYDKCRELGL